MTIYDNNFLQNKQNMKTTIQKTHNSHTFHARSTSPVPTFLFFFLRGVTRQLQELDMSEKPVHRARCQRRWVGPWHTVPKPTSPVYGTGTLPQRCRKGTVRRELLGATGTSPCHEGVNTPNVAPKAASPQARATTRAHSSIIEKAHSKIKSNSCTTKSERRETKRNGTAMSEAILWAQCHSRRSRLNSITRFTPSDGILL